MIYKEKMLAELFCCMKENRTSQGEEYNAAWQALIYLWNMWGTLSISASEIVCDKAFSLSASLFN